MSNVLVDRQKIDILANAISAKSGENIPLTFSEMVEAVDGIEAGGGDPNLQSKTYTVDSAGTETITADSGYDGLSSVVVSVPSTDPVVDCYGSYTTESNVRKWLLNVYTDTDGESGWFDGTVSHTRTKKYNAVLKNTTVTPTTSQQTIGGSDYMMEGAVTVEAMPSGTAGTPTATKGTVSNHSISVTPSVTNTTGYITGGTKTGTAVTVSASELVSGNKSIVAAGNSIDVTDYATVSVASGSATAPATISGTAATVSTGTNTLTLTKTISITPTVSAGYVSSGTAGNSSVSLTANVTTKAAATITPTTSNQTIAAGTYLTGAQTIAGDSNLVASNIKKNVPIFGVTGSYEGDGGGESEGIKIGTSTYTLSARSNSIGFETNGEVTSFVVLAHGQLTPNQTPLIASNFYDGTNFGNSAQLITNTSNGQVSYTSAGCYFEDQGNMLIIRSAANDFEATQYDLIYTYGGSTSDIYTSDVQVGSGATSITFTGLEGEPTYWSCVFKSNFSTSSGYQRVIAVANDGINTIGLEMDSSAHYSDSHWTASYNNGSLTITSQSTNAGGYFHQPGYYQLTYCIDGTVAPIEIEVEPLSITQNGTYTAPSGKAYSPVTVAVSGGGGANIDTKSVTNSSNQNTSISFSSMKGQPKAFFARCTATLSRSSSNTYYYVADMVYDGTSTVGNMHARSNGQYSNITSGYSWSYSGTTLTLTSSGARNTSPGSFYNGTYELVYIY